MPRSCSMVCKVITLLALLFPATASAQRWFRPYEPFHLQPIAPASGLLLEARPVVFDYTTRTFDFTTSRIIRRRDASFGIGSLLEGRIALLRRRLHIALCLPWGLGVVPDRTSVQLGNLDLGAGYGAPIGRGGWRWGLGARVLVPMSRHGGPGAYAGWASRPYNFERHTAGSADARVLADIGVDTGSFVGQLEAGADFFIPPRSGDLVVGADPPRPGLPVIARIGGLLGAHLAPRTILMVEVASYGAFTPSQFHNADIYDNAQLSIEPGIRFGAGRSLDLAFYLTVPIDPPLGGHALALGFQLLWTP